MPDSSPASTQPTGDLFSVAGKVAVVTGGSRGIGAMIARGLVQAGLPGLHHRAEGGRLRRQGGRAVSIRRVHLDPAGPGRNWLSGRTDAPLAEREEQLDILVNNAGVTWGAPLAEYPPDAFDRVMVDQYQGGLRADSRLVCRCCAPPPARRIRPGSSTSAPFDGLGVPPLESYAYSASKAGVHMLTRHLASRLAAESITVNAIAPGPFDSKMMAFVLDDPQTRAAVAEHVPLGRIGEPDDMAGATIFLASRAGRYLTGALIPVDGGIASLR